MYNDMLKDSDIQRKGEILPKKKHHKMCAEINENS